MKCLYKFENMELKGVTLFKGDTKPWKCRKCKKIFSFCRLHTLTILAMFIQLEHIFAWISAHWNIAILAEYPYWFRLLLNCRKVGSWCKWRFSHTFWHTATFMTSQTPSWCHKHFCDVTDTLPPSWHDRCAVTFMTSDTLPPSSFHRHTATFMMSQTHCHLHVTDMLPPSWHHRHTAKHKMAALLVMFLQLSNLDF